MTPMDNSDPSTGTLRKVLDISALTIRILTLPLVLAAILAFSLYAYEPAAFGGSILEPILLTVFLAIIPIMGYPIQMVVPEWKKQGRPFQRKLAFIMSASGYTAGLVYCIISRTAGPARLIYYSYFISLLVLTAFNFGMHIRSSAHAAGIAGPLCILVICMNPWLCLVSIPVYGLSLWASVRLKRHTVREFILGTVCGLSAVGAAHLLIRFWF